MPIENDNSKNNKEEMNILLKLIKLLLDMFGLGGGKPLDDKFIENTENRDMIKAQVKDVMKSDFKKSLCKFALNIPFVKDMVKDQLEKNPKLKEFVKEVVAEHPEIQNMLKNNKEFSDLLPKKAADLQQLEDSRTNEQKLSQDNDNAKTEHP